MKVDKTEFQALITYYIKKRGLTGLNELSESTLISYKTLLKYWNDPERFPLGEVGRILDTLKIPAEEFLERVMTNKGGVNNEAEEDFKKSMHCSYSGSSALNNHGNHRHVVNLADKQPGNYSTHRI